MNSQQQWDPLANQERVIGNGPHLPRNPRRGPFLPVEATADRMCRAKASRLSAGYCAPDVDRGMRASSRTLDCLFKQDSHIAQGLRSGLGKTLTSMRLSQELVALTCRIVGSLASARRSLDPDTNSLPLVILVINATSKIIVARGQLTVGPPRIGIVGFHRRQTFFESAASEIGGVGFHPSSPAVYGRSKLAQGARRTQSR